MSVCVCAWTSSFSLVLSFFDFVLCIYFILFFSPCQVKVWFQNRRTKYKRIKAEEDGEEEPKKKGSHHVTRWQIETQQS